MSHAFRIYSVGAFRPIKFALGCAVSVLLLQVLVFDESLLAGGFMRGFLTWILGLIVIQSLSFRKGFFHRFALVAFLIGCGTLPFLKIYVATEEMMRVGGEGMPLGNPELFWDVVWLLHYLFFSDRVRSQKLSDSNGFLVCWSSLSLSGGHYRKPGGVAGSSYCNGYCI